MNIKTFPKPGANCENALKCFFDLNNQDLKVYRNLLEKGPGTSIDLGERINRDRSTAYRSVTKLVENDLAVKRTVKREGGGIYHEYEAKDPKEVQSLLINAIDEWYMSVRNMVEMTTKELEG